MTRIILSSGDMLWCDGTVDEALAVLDAGSDRVRLGKVVVSPAAVVLVDEVPAPVGADVEQIYAPAHKSASEGDR